MLDWVRVVESLSWLLSRGGRRADGSAEARAFLGAPPGPMAPLRASEAANDDVLSAICGEVERELRRAGYLR